VFACTGRNVVVEGTVPQEWDPDLRQLMLCFKIINYAGLLET